MKILSNPVFKRQWWTKQRIVIFTITFLAVVIMSIIRGAHQEIGFDFYVVWNAGRNFFTGQPLYPTEIVEGVRYFLYPPFAAMMYQIFAVFPLKVAGGLYYLMNIVLLIASIYLTKLIFEQFYPNRTNLKWPLIFSIFFSARFFINNINLLQANEIILVLCLLGIYAYLKRRIGLSGCLFTVATFLKIVPIFFIFWIMVRGRAKAIISVVLTGIICLSLPVLQRGFEKGTKDGFDYYHSFLKPFQKGKVRTTYLNQNLAAAIYRMALTSKNEENLNYQILSLPEATVKAIYKISFVTILLIFVANIIYLSLKRFPVSSFEISSVFLVGFLLSGITQKAQLIPLIFVLMAFLSIDYKELTKRYRYVFCVLYCLVVILGVTGREILGSRLHLYFGGYSIITWIVLILFIFSIWFSNSHRFLCNLKSYNQQTSAV